jgi:hypothetical protein
MIEIPASPCYHRAFKGGRRDTDHQAKFAAARPLRLRQDHAAAHDWVSTSQSGSSPSAASRWKHQPAAADQHGVPELRDLPAFNVEQNVAYGLGG